MHTKHKTNSGVFPTDVGLALPQLDVGIPELQDPSTVDTGRKNKCVMQQRLMAHYIIIMILYHLINIMIFSHCFHVVLWLQGDLQDFGATDNLLIAGGRDCLAGDAVDLIESVGLEDALVRRTDEDLQAKWILASVAM